MYTKLHSSSRQGTVPVALQNTQISPLCLVPPPLPRPRVWQSRASSFGKGTRAWAGIRARALGRGDAEPMAFTGLYDCGWSRHGGELKDHCVQMHQHKKGGRWRMAVAGPSQKVSLASSAWQGPACPVCSCSAWEAGWRAPKSYLQLGVCTGVTPTGQGAGECSQTPEPPTWVWRHRHGCKPWCGHSGFMGSI